VNFERRITLMQSKQTRLWVAVAFLFALVATLFQFGAFLADSYAAVRFPWKLDYGEGIVWEQMRLMVAGRGYGAIDRLPAIVFHYPPVYHMLVAALSGACGLDPLAAGRSVSLGSTLLAGLFAGLISAKTVRADDGPHTALVCALVSGLTVFCFSPIAFWAPLMRVDMLSVALSLAGVLVAMAAFTRSRLIVASGLLFVAAVFTKQTSIVAPAAVFLTFLLVRPRLAWVLAATCMVAGLVVLGALQLVTDGGFIRHIFLYNANRFDPQRLPWIAVAIISHFFLVSAVVIGVTARLRARWPVYSSARTAAIVRQRLGAASGDAFLLLILVYAVLAFVMTFTIAKSGSNVNYFIECMAVLAIVLGVGARDAANALLGTVSMPSKRLLAHPVVVPLLIGLQPLVSGKPSDHAKQQAVARPAELEALQAMVRSASRPVISDDMVLLMRAGVPVQLEPAIFAELASTGTWNEAPFVERIRARRFAFFITTGQRGDWLFDSRYNPAVADAMDAAYPIRRDLAGYSLHFPREEARQPRRAVPQILGAQTPVSVAD